MLNYNIILYNAEVPSAQQPTVKDLMNDVAAHAKSWRDIGLQLLLMPSELDGIEQSRNKDINQCYADVFEKWKKAGEPPFTWRTIIDALRSPSVKNNDLADRIEKKYVVERN